LGKHLGINVMVTTGGTGLKDDIIRLNDSIHIIVGTPGRVLDLAGKGVADLSECPIFVMDEADKLLSPEFTPTIEQLLSYHPKDRQVMLFSATFPMVVKSFKDKHSAVSHNTMLLSKKRRRSTALTRSSQNFRSTSPLSSAIPPTASNYSPRKSLNWATLVSIPTPVCYNITETASSTISVTVSAVTSSVPIF
jgi:superfamily II DNA/RNA helicase